MKLEIGDAYDTGKLTDADVPVLMQLFKEAGANVSGFPAPYWKSRKWLVLFQGFVDGKLVPQIRYQEEGTNHFMIRREVELPRETEYDGKHYRSTLIAIRDLINEALE